MRFAPPTRSCSVSPSSICLVQPKEDRAYILTSHDILPADGFVAFFIFDRLVVPQLAAEVRTSKPICIRLSLSLSAIRMDNCVSAQPKIDKRFQVLLRRPYSSDIVPDAFVCHEPVKLVLPDETLERR